MAEESSSSAVKMEDAVFMPPVREMRKRTAMNEDSECVYIMRILHVYMQNFSLNILFVSSALAKIQSGFFEVKAEEERRKQKRRSKK